STKPSPTDKVKAGGGVPGHCQTRLKVREPWSLSQDRPRRPLPWVCCSAHTTVPEEIPPLLIHLLPKSFEEPKVWWISIFCTKFCPHWVQLTQSCTGPLPCTPKIGRL